jgi:hypothetical protein
MCQKVQAENAKITSVWQMSVTGRVFLNMEVFMNDREFSDIEVF